MASNRIIGTCSRFEVDFNRPRENAIYLDAASAWGLNVWKNPPPDSLIQSSLSLYDAFYEDVRLFFDDLLNRFGRIVVFDLHSYNHRRNGQDQPRANPDLNPEVNVGTGTMHRQRWATVVDRFLADLRQFEFLGRQLDVRENVKFSGGHFPGWIHENYPGRVCVLSIEIKKFFMCEWTGEANRKQTDAIRKALSSTVAGVIEEVRKR